LLLLSENCQINIQNQFIATQYQFTPQFFKLITFGFWPAAVEGLWIQTMQFIGTGKYPPSAVPAVRQFYDLATDLDPNFYELYDQSAILFSILFESADDAEHFLNKGIAVYKSGTAPAAFWTHPVTLYIYLGYVQAFQQHDWAKAKQTYLEASMLPNPLPWLVDMRHWLQEKNSEKRLARNVITIMINGTKDEEVKKILREKLKKYE